MQDDTFSAAAALRALHDELQVKLEESEDFRVARLLDYVVMKETARPDAEQGREVQDQPSALAAVRALSSQIRSRLERREDFRVLRGLAFAITQEAQRKGGQPRPEQMPSTPVRHAQSAPAPSASDQLVAAPPSVATSVKPAENDSSHVPPVQKSSKVEELLEAFQIRASG